MIKYIVRWWNTLLRQEFIYVVSWIDKDADEHCCLCFYDVKDAVDYASTIKRIYKTDAYVLESELL